jgi:hypothetical protein
MHGVYLVKAKHLVSLTIQAVRDLQGDACKLANQAAPST